jgi:hypothetical protein
MMHCSLGKRKDCKDAIDCYFISNTNTETSLIDLSNIATCFQSKKILDKQELNFVLARIIAKLSPSYYL